MFHEYNEPSNTKILNISLLGSDRKFQVSIYGDTSLKELRQLCEQKHQISLRHFRVFTQDGVELFNEDLIYLKDNSKLYITRGEDFDANIIHQEYEILEQLGKGGFGKVLLGRHKESLNLVAIKYVNTRNRDANDIELVFREAYLMKSLNHKHIVKFYNCYPLSNMQVIVVMEYLEGGDLQKYTQAKGQLCEEEARMYFRQICDAMMYCHNRKLIHRDLKLENIMFANKNDTLIKIVDFGIAGMAVNSNMDKLNIGTIRYMAPETLQGNNSKIGPHIDVWAMGVILFHLIFGKYPFEGDSNFDIIQNITNNNYTFSKKNVSPYLIDLLSRIFFIDPQKRIKLYDILNHEWMKISFEQEYFETPQTVPRTQFRLPSIENPKQHNPPLKQKKLNRSFTPLKKSSPRRLNSFIIKGVLKRYQ
ncbi:unnamed protein product [Paramecium sonneborni]|uniref:Protein kinase domain-containing protein n=1 Tax=Paramecium sonneborni TaxID=65129 RepID=A0A8S1RKW2_9CILI|nr:unnamed protein product [Paramecium sonneborni]